MSKRQNLLAVWQQIPVANRTVGAAASVTGAVGSVTTVSDKTGYSLTAGSYVVRASSTQAGSITLGAGVSSNTATISSVTTTRTTITHLGYNDNTTATEFADSLSRMTLTNATTVTADRGDTTGSCTGGFNVLELF